MISIGACTRRKIISLLDSRLRFQFLEKSTFCGACYLSSKNVSYRNIYCSAGSKQKAQLTKSEGTSGEVSTSVSEKIKEGTKTATYGTVILVGLGITGLILYTIFGELFFGDSPSSIYSKSVERCINNERVQMGLGEPIRAFGEETRRRRRRHAAQLLYEKDGVNYFRMKFYLKGTRNDAVVNLEMKENEKGRYEYRYLFVELSNYPHTVIVIEDNRDKDSSNTVLADTKDSLSLL